jgi:hypothetical protein
MSYSYKGNTTSYGNTGAIGHVMYTASNVTPPYGITMPGATSLVLTSFSLYNTGTWLITGNVAIQNNSAANYITLAVTEGLGHINTQGSTGIANTTVACNSLVSSNNFQSATQVSCIYQCKGVTSLALNIQANSGTTKNISYNFSVMRIG